VNEKTIATIALRSGGYKDLNSTLAEAADLLTLASAQGAQLAVLPETINLYHRANDATPLEEFALENWEQATEALRETAAQLKVSLVLPLLVRDHGVLANRFYVLSSDGSLLGSYQKRVLAPGEREAGVESRRSAPIPWEGLKIGGAICIDVYYPNEVFDPQVDSGADFFVIPSLTPAGSVLEWNAVMSGVPIVLAYSPWSRILDRDGSELAASGYRWETLSAGSGSPVLQATINFDAVTLFADYNQQKMREVQRHYGPNVRIRFDQSNCLFTLESRSADLSVTEIMQQFGLLSRREYFTQYGPCAPGVGPHQSFSIASQGVRVSLPKQAGPLRFAVIGCGAVAQAQHIPNIVRSPRMTLHTCVDLDDKVLAECRDVYGATHVRKDFEGAIEDPEVDVICLATTEKLRLPVIALAAKAGKPVYVEKPLATTLEEMREIQRVVRAANIPFCVGHNRRASPAMVDAQRIFRQHMTHPEPCPWRWTREADKLPMLAADGVPSVSVRINDDWHSWKSWVFDKTHAPFGPMLFEMTHFTDVCNWFLDDVPVEVTAVETSMLNEAVIVRYQSGALATIVLANNGTFGYCKELYEFMGNGAYLAVDHMLEVRSAGIEGVAAKTTYPMMQDRHPEIGIEGGVSGWLAKKRAACAEAAAQQDPLLQFTAEPDKGHAHALERFVDQILDIGPEVCGVDAAVLATRVSFAAIRSAYEKRRVLLSEIDI